MMQITSFKIGNLRIEEVFAFHQRVQQYAEELPTTGALIAEGLPETSVTFLTTGVDTHKTAVEGLDSALKVSTTVPSAKWVMEADANRDFAWTGLYNYVKAMTAHPDESIAEAAKRVTTSRRTTRGSAACSSTSSRASATCSATSTWKAGC